MHVLIDTNIFIYREDDRIISNNMQRLLSTLQQTGAEILIHPLSLVDLKRDRDQRRRQVLLSKIRSYPFLASPPDPRNDSTYLDKVKQEARERDEVDDAILYAVYKDAIDFLITEDRGIHKKAFRLGIDNRVLLINDALQIFEGYIHKEQVITPPSLKQEYVYNLNLEDPIFSSFSRSYEEFEGWFRKVSREGRQCFVSYRDDGSIGALLIYKIEDEPIDSNPPLPKKKRLKLSTFKVTHVGYKIGELFIKLSIDIAIKNGIPEIYLTHFIKPEDRLVELISEYGFYKSVLSKRGEDVFVKRMVANANEVAMLSPAEIDKKFYPTFYEGVLVRKFIVPIRPEYHNRLFTNFQERQTTLSEHAGEFIIEGNTITKAYICHSKARRMSAGDLLLFYLSRRQELTSIGVVEAAYSGMQDSDDIIRLVGKRTVYSRKEIEEMTKKPITVILFRHHFHLKNPLPLRELKALKVLAGAPQSIIQITDESYAKIKMEGGMDERFTIN